MHPSIYLSIHLSIYLSIYIYINKIRKKNSSQPRCKGVSHLQWRRWGTSVSMEVSRGKSSNSMGISMDFLYKSIDKYTYIHIRGLHFSFFVFIYIIYMLVGGFKHLDYFPFHILYGMSSQLTKSYFSRWLLHHQPDIYIYIYAWICRNGGCRLKIIEVNGGMYQMAYHHIPPIRGPVWSSG